MKLFLLSYLLICLFGLTVIAVAPQKAVIVTYPDDAPDSVLDQTKKEIERAGGIITHEYKLIRGFAAQASTRALEAVQALSSQYLPLIEEDSIVSIDGDLIRGGHTN
ncbi:hypothetical protein EPUS_01268 [Endocarpon pusillum Z07020]|uniref:Inhibitor I9 domain-containing protein n=1 Tax=Endocarpon pusillum (strain Z07020 / HMAS-L-300199) TaxID=1263415 RepID=U1GE62_ENDPU|nr:uncharacterized protein EPUS_01268 [Endocarpon pusillum Z07020]ERF75902.1 hypothetical protein EPUS_01268 [Endocarpon pusillum Z07020]